MFNDLIDELHGVIAFRAQQLEMGSNLITTLSDVLWYMDPFHRKFSERSLQVPKFFQKFSGYRDWKKQHKMEPRVCTFT